MSFLFKIHFFFDMSVVKNQIVSKLEINDEDAIIP